MKPQHEKLLVATLAGLIITSAAAFAVSPAVAAGYVVDQKAQVSNLAWWDHLNVRKWPAWYSKKVGTLQPSSWVWVERCVTVEQASDWCKIEVGPHQGWVNSSYLVVHNPFSDDDTHHIPN